MKKFLGIAGILILLALLLAWPYMIIFKKDCKISDLGMSLALPGNGYLLTRKDDRTGLPIDLYRFFKDTDIDDEFKKNAIYMSARYNNFEIQIDAFEDFGTIILFDLDRISNEEREGIVQSLAELYPNDKVTLNKFGSTSYITIDYQNKKIGDSYTTRSYMTIKNGKLINIALLCADKQMNAERIGKVQQVVESIQYK